MALCMYMVAPPSQVGGINWIQAQSKKHLNLLGRSDTHKQNTHQPSCKHHAIPDSLIRPNILDNDTTSYVDILMGKKKSLPKRWANKLIVTLWNKETNKI